MTDAEKARLAELKPDLQRFFNAFAAGYTKPITVELRMLGVPRTYGAPGCKSGFFELPTQATWDTAEKLRKALAEVLCRPPEEHPEGIYVTLNPVSPDLLARAADRMLDVGRKALAATDRDIVSRRWLLVDVDPVRRAGISATDAEKATARHVIDGVRADLDARGWPAPMVIDSGNGYHLWYRIDLPADDDGLVERCLRALAARHDTPDAHVDTSVYNPARIAKVPGTWSRKGDSIPDRPHRIARVLEVPADLEAVGPGVAS